MFAFGLVPPPGFAQTTSGDRQASKDKERAREEREWREIHRTQERMRKLDRERAAERSRQDADWRREMDERNQRGQPAQPARPGVSSSTRTPPAPDPYAPPAAASAARPSSSPASSATCHARPVCLAAGGRANLCMGVQSSYSGSNPGQTGLADIARRCREANTPEPCPRSKRLDPAAPTYKLDAAPALSCAEQCAKVARCATAATR